MVKDSNIQAFFEQLKAGLWSDWRSVQEFNVQEFKDVDWERVYQLAQEQSVQGVVLRGIEELRAKNLEFRTKFVGGGVPSFAHRNIHHHHLRTSPTWFLCLRPTIANK